MARSYSSPERAPLLNWRRSFRTAAVCSRDQRRHRIYNHDRDTSASVVTPTISYSRRQGGTVRFDASNEKPVVCLCRSETVTKLSLCFEL